MSRSRRLTVVLVLNLVLVAGLVAVGLSAGSLSVLAEGVDYLADSVAIGVSLLAIWFSKRAPSPTRPHGYPRATAMAALVNSGWLLALSLLVIAGATDRLATATHHVQGLPVLIVSSIAAVVMLSGALILRGDHEVPGEDDNDNENDNDDLNLRAVLLDTSADAAAAAGVAVTGGIILAAGGLYWLDSAVALVIAAVVAYHALRLLRRVAASLRVGGSG